jgi:hypothetical protein
LGEVDLYCRENLEQFFKWKDSGALEHFSDEIDCADRASDYARSKPRANGFISFKSKYRGKRYFWVERGEAYEIDPMECFLKIRDLKREKSKEIIHRKLFRRA